MGHKLNHIELFAGCGGLNLGLAAAGFELLFANELSPMAATTFAYNFLAEDLEELAGTNGARAKSTKWLASAYPDGRLKDRLRENPQANNVAEPHCDLTGKLEDLKGKLVVGSIVDFNRWLEKNKQVVDALEGKVDLISGGPPCQSFSMAGMREYTNARNKLPGEFAEFVAKLKPKFVLLENVSGILRPFDVDGQKVYAWIEVAKAFAEKQYVPLCVHTNARFAGVAQNRPRFVMIGIRYDGVYDLIKQRLEEKEPGLFTQSEIFYNKVQENLPIEDDDIRCFDLNKDNALFKGLLSPLRHHKQYNVQDAIDDLRQDEEGQPPSEYVDLLESTFAGHLNRAHPFEEVQNRELRSNSDKVRRRFRLYQVLLEEPSAQKAVQGVLGGESDSLPPEVADQLLDYEYLLPDGSHGRFKGNLKEKRKKLDAFLIDHRTRKHSQKALDPKQPAPAALSIPDDACHYNWAYDDLRTLSVREMARIQSFPDEFAFRSKVTTGGQMRKFEVPQYTQVGNAVPPLLGKALGEVIQKLEDYYQEATRPQRTRVTKRQIAIEDA
ncbi:MAG TPA: DNA cytosine methyltransferase [Noviherbaspirillum sp.]|uniref:DNA cytosine methyltransferase n=1 Tax=Noviherbaspirillum sp. TaxID=1926288 RepID=UPI002B45DEEA|nr:DNA cytosine methyltransferase [Noviherbaspirillum sp.]HJV86597.1 DNA cytosine methyltransferase [Noviherbaspirillum sp.]